MEDRKSLFKSIMTKIESMVDSEENRSVKLQAICELFAESVPHYDWVGFYLVDENAERELVLGPFVGEPTEHVRIPFGSGICGQAAEREETFVIQDVSKENNYLSCSIHVKSEIVVPIFKGDKIVGELDIDSHTSDVFQQEDRDFCEQVCKLIEKIF